MVMPANPAPSSGNQNTRVHVEKIKVRAQLKQGILNRDPAGALVNPGGNTKLNVTATEMLYALARSVNLAPDSFLVGVGFGKESGGLYLYAEPTDALEALPIRHEERRHTCSFSLAPVFALKPEIRPSARKQCALAEATDQDGVACLMLNLDVSLVKRRNPANKKSGATKSADPATSTPHKPTETNNT